MPISVRHMRPALVALVALAAAALPLVGGAPARGVAVLPSGFSDELVLGVGSPTAIAFTPDGRLLVTTQPGRLRVVQNGVLLGTAALDISGSVCSNSERGLLGVAVDPAFATNRYIYLYYTYKKFPSAGCPTNTSSAPVNRVSRFVLADNNTVNPGTQTVLIDNMYSPNGNHNGGDVEFGRDGNLYVSVGDGGCYYANKSLCAGANPAARKQFVLNGKVLRITPAGGIPAGNPFVGSTSDRCNVTGHTAAGRTCRETYLRGLRNPFRIAFDPNGTANRFYVNDVGQNTWEEIDRGQSGADYGWNLREGHCATGSTTNCGAPPAGMTNPIFDYRHLNGCGAITGGAFVPNGVWPSTYNGAYLFSDFNCGQIFRLVPNGTGFTRTTFASGLGGGSAVHLRFGPWGSTQALYYTTYATGGQIRRIHT